MKKRHILVCGLCLLLFSMSIHAKRLMNVTYHMGIKDQIRIDFTFDEAVKLDDAIFLMTAKKISIDFSKVTAQETVNSLPNNIFGILDFTMRYVDETLNVLMLLDRKFVATWEATDKNYSLLLTPRENNASPARELIAINQITSLAFKLDQNQRLRMVVPVMNDSLRAVVHQRQRHIAIIFPRATITSENLHAIGAVALPRRIEKLRVFSQDDGVHLVLQMSDAFDVEYINTEQRFVLTLLESIHTETRKHDRPTKAYTGNKISLNFQNIPVRYALQMIADINNFNLVVDDSVTGNMTVRLDSVPWDQALDVILTLTGLGQRIEGNILLIAPLQELAMRAAHELKINQEVEKYLPLTTQYVQIKYAKAKEIAVLLSGANSKILSSRGSVAVDSRTNTLLIQDTIEQLTEVKRLIDKLDIAVKQVIIEARIVTVTDNINEEFGIQWGVSNTLSDVSTSGSSVGASAINTGKIPVLDDRLNVRLPVIEAAGTIAFQVSKLADGLLLDLELSALERENKGEIIARPSITTADQQSAFIEQGHEIPYVSAVSSGATTVTFKPAVLSLKVTPHITPDNRVILDLHITQDTRGDTVKTATGEAIAINTQRIGTQVLVNNEETIVLGGIYQQQLIYGVSKVPILGDIPGLGWLFRAQKNFTERRELLIFVTPKIVKHNQL